MKRLSLAAGLFAAVACAGLYAQTVDLQSNIPFDFRIGEKLMPAGEYLIHNSSDGVLMVRERNGSHASAVQLTIPASRKAATAKGALEFNRYGDAYFLSKIWTPESREGRALFKSKRETEVASGAGAVYSASVPLRK